MGRYGCRMAGQLKNSGRDRSCRCQWQWLAALIVTVLVRVAVADELSDAQKLFQTGKYAECEDACTKAIDSGERAAAWYVLKGRAELAIGKNEEALKTYQAGVDEHDTSMVIRLMGYDAYLANDKPDDADDELSIMKMMASIAPRQFEDTPSRIALGRALLKSGADAKQVLEQYFDKARKASPDAPEPYLATGELALEKKDYALAADSFRDAIKHAPDDPDAYIGLARSFAEGGGDEKQATAALQEAISRNPNHIASILFEADNLIDREAYDQAESLLKKALAINPKDARVWAYRSVVAYLTGNHKNEDEYRAKALETWKTNPEVDWLIGLKLAHEYRFAEGEAHQRKALSFKEDYLPAKVQLCQDLLRLGKEDEGWKLADEVFKADPYSVEMFNLVTLRDVIKKFKPVENEHFLILMDPKEADIYGQRALTLVTEAREKLSKKYATELPDKTTIEIFPAQKDFAIRTFGLPGGEGFLGVCFGPVVTVNSPQSRAATPSNWEAILWHEFCHSITLNKTKNKMPRWLSEGISVYEEMQRNPTWGEHMTPDYRELVIKGEATPVSQLSKAFMAPPTPLHLMFAYYESSQVVDFVVKHWGGEALNGVLTDLGNDVSINEALARHTEPIAKLDADFAAYLKDLAQGWAAKVDWSEQPIPPGAKSEAFTAFNKEHPNNLWMLLKEGRSLLEERRFGEAKAPLEKAIALLPDYVEGGGGYEMLAAAERELGEKKQERDTLQKYVDLDPHAIDARLRLMTLVAAGGTPDDWKLVKKQAVEVLGVNPLIAEPYEFLARAATELGDHKTAIEARRTILKLDPLDAAEQHYQLARLLMGEKELPDARREVVLSLEDAPRYRAALSLLLEIAARMDAPPQTATQPAPEAIPASTMPATLPARDQEKQP